MAAHIRAASVQLVPSLAVAGRHSGTGAVSPARRAGVAQDHRELLRGSAGGSSAEPFGAEGGGPV